MSDLEASPPAGYDPAAGESIAETLRGLATLLELDPANAPQVFVAVVFPDDTLDSFGNLNREVYRRILWTLCEREFEFAQLQPKGK